MAIKRPKLDPFVPIIDQILEDDKSKLKKQRYKAKRSQKGMRVRFVTAAALARVLPYI